MAEDADNPYVGPRPFESGDRALFFGRDAEARELLSLVVSERVVLLYAASGAGKTSLLHAGVVPLLAEEEHFEVLPVARIRAGLPDELLGEVRNVYTAGVLAALVEEEDDGRAEGELGRLTLAEFLARRPHVGDEQGLAAPRALIVDQFEELFTLYPAYWRQREQFVRDLADALAADPLLRVVLAIREDYVAQLDSLAPLLPRELRTRFRLERLGPDAAIAAVVNPTEATSRSYAPGVAEKLVADLLRFRIDTGRGESVEIEGEYVEPVQLQVACQSLWNGLPGGVTEITEDHLRTFGDVDEVLRRFYDEAVRAAAVRARMLEGRLRARVEESFITSVGTRNTVYRRTDETGGLPNTAVDELEKRRVIRADWRAGTRWYELTHDRLIAPIQTSNARFRAKLGRKRRNRAMAGVGALVVVAGALVGSALLIGSDGSNDVEALVPQSVEFTLGTPQLGQPGTRFATMDIAISANGLRGKEVQILASVLDRRDNLVVRPKLQTSVRPLTDRPPPDAALIKVVKPTRAGTYTIEIEAQFEVQEPTAIRSHKRSKPFVIDSKGEATVPGSRSLEIQPAGPGTVAAHLGGSTTKQYCPPLCSLSYSAGQKVTLTASPANKGVFIGWAGCSSTTPVCVLKGSGTTRVGAMFGRTHVLGHASSGKPITAFELGNPAAKRKVLVVGCMKLSECQGTAIAAALAKKTSLPDIDLWIIEKLNPDGDGDRGSTDPSPNKNFPCEWVNKPQYSGTDYSDYTKDCAGHKVPSQPEARAAFNLVRRIRPTLTVWYLARVDDGVITAREREWPAWVARTGGGRSRVVGRRFAGLVGLPFGGADENLEPAGGYPGSGSAWQWHTRPADVAFWVELPAKFSRSAAEKHAEAILTVARDL